MLNPYHHPSIKTHQIERDDIRLLAFEIYNLIRASIGQQGIGIIGEEESREFTELEKLHFELAEGVLSKKLLQLALLVRTFDDIMGDGDTHIEYERHRVKIEQENGAFGVVFDGKEGITNSIRECSNKIIHAQDFRPVYDTNDEGEDSSIRWGMDGSIELQGTLGGALWSISLDVFSYLEGTIELVSFGA